MNGGRLLKADGGRRLAVGYCWLLAVGFFGVTLVATLGDARCDER